MILITGLGNPGLQYAYTRHNIGFMLCDCLARRLSFPNFIVRFDSLVSEKVIDKFKVFIQKPQTYMNLSGESVKKIVYFYKISTDEVFVIHDDIDLPLYDIRVKFSGSSGGHNGIRSIDGGIGKDYWRIRIGVGRPLNKYDVSEYVLSKFYNDELQKMSAILLELADNMQDLITNEDKDKVIQKIQRIGKP